MAWFGNESPEGLCCIACGAASSLWRCSRCKARELSIHKVRLVKKPLTTPLAATRSHSVIHVKAECQQEDWKKHRESCAGKSDLRSELRVQNLHGWKAFNLRGDQLAKLKHQECFGLSLLEALEKIPRGWRLKPVNGRCVVWILGARDGIEKRQILEGGWHRLLSSLDVGWDIALIGPEMEEDKAVFVHNGTRVFTFSHFLPSIGKTSLPDWNMAVVLPVHAGDATDASSAGTPAVVSIPPAEELVPSIDLTSAKGTEASDPKKEPTLLTKKESTSPIKKGSNSPSKKDFVCPMEVTVTLNTEDAGDHEQKNLEVPVRKSPPCYGPNNSARRANRRKNGSPGPTTRQSSPPLLTPDSRSPASSRPASPFSPASSPAARRHSHAEVTVPAARSVSQRRPSAPVVSAPSPTPAFTHPQLVAHPLRNSRSMKDTREGARSESHDECIPRARSQSQKRVKNPADPFDLARFTEAQKENGTFERAIGEIKAGRKSSCWMWFVIPSPPHMKNNVEHGSSMNRKFLGCNSMI
eukprot:symbB.v1.2.000632.t1/scaffold26.1/size418576/47